jgi:hypothetical protein
MRRKPKIESETQLQSRLEKEALRAKSGKDEALMLDEMIQKSIRLHGA